ncbi:MAG: hypothetical protein JWP73_744, partial [Phenylobacterium sp.]|nr:hypothetical protein [Phenylobacterium sp.]
MRAAALLSVVILAWAAAAQGQ